VKQRQTHKNLKDAVDAKRREKRRWECRPKICEGGRKGKERKEGMYIISHTIG